MPAAPLPLLRSRRRLLGLSTFTPINNSQHETINISRSSSAPPSASINTIKSILVTMFESLWTSNKAKKATEQLPSELAQTKKQLENAQAEAAKGAEVALENKELKAQHAGLLQENEEMMERMKMDQVEMEKCATSMEVLESKIAKVEISHQAIQSKNKELKQMSANDKLDRDYKVLQQINADQAEKVASLTADNEKLAQDNKNLHQSNTDKDQKIVALTTDKEKFTQNNQILTKTNTKASREIAALKRSNDQFNRVFNSSQQYGTTTSLEVNKFRRENATLNEKIEAFQDTITTLTQNNLKLEQEKTQLEQLKSELDTETSKKISKLEAKIRDHQKKSVLANMEKIELVREKDELKKELDELKTSRAVVVSSRNTTTCFRREGHLHPADLKAITNMINEQAWQSAASRYKCHTTEGKELQAIVRRVAADVFERCLNAATYTQSILIENNQLQQDKCDLTFQYHQLTRMAAGVEKVALAYQSAIREAADIYGHPAILTLHEAYLTNPTQADAANQNDVEEDGFEEDDVEEDGFEEDDFEEDGFEEDGFEEDDFEEDGFEEDEVEVTETYQDDVLPDYESIESLFQDAKMGCPNYKGVASMFEDDIEAEEHIETEDKPAVYEDGDSTSGSSTNHDGRSSPENESTIGSSASSNHGESEGTQDAKVATQEENTAQQPLTLDVADKATSVAFTFGIAQRVPSFDSTSSHAVDKIFANVFAIETPITPSEMTTTPTSFTFGDGPPTPEGNGAFVFGAASTGMAPAHVAQSDEEHEGLQLTAVDNGQKGVEENSKKTIDLKEADQSTSVDIADNDEPETGLVHDGRTKKVKQGKRKQTSKQKALNNWKGKGKGKGRK